MIDIFYGPYTRKVTGASNIMDEFTDITKLLPALFNSEQLTLSSLKSLNISQSPCQRYIHTHQHSDRACFTGSLILIINALNDQLYWNEII